MELIESLEEDFSKFLDEYEKFADAKAELDAANQANARDTAETRPPAWRSHCQGSGERKKLPAFDGDRFGYRQWRIRFTKAKENLGFDDGAAFQFLMDDGLAAKEIKEHVRLTINRCRDFADALQVLDEEYAPFALGSREVDRRIADLPSGTGWEATREVKQKLEILIGDLEALDGAHDSVDRRLPSEELLTRQRITKSGSNWTH